MVPFPATFGFKCFLADSGVEEFPHLGPAEFASAVRTVGEFDGLMIVHAEDGHALEHVLNADGRGYGAFLASQPPGAENLAIAEVSRPPAGPEAGCTSGTCRRRTRCR